MILVHRCIIYFILGHFRSKFDASLSCFFLTHKCKSLITSHRMLFAVTVSRNNEGWKRLNLARTFADKLETFTWLSEIRQNYIVESSISRLWIKCTRVHFTFHLKSDTLTWKHSPTGVEAFYTARQSFPQSLCTTPPKVHIPPCLWGGV